jgi:hypothetical protein
MATMTRDRESIAPTATCAKTRPRSNYPITSGFLFSYVGLDAAIKSAVGKQHRADEESGSSRIPASDYIGLLRFSLRSAGA